MARIEYDEIAKDYRAGRGLREDGLAGWREAVRPYLEHLRQPLVDVGSGAGQFSALFPNWFGIDVIGVEPSDGMRAEAISATDDPRVRYVPGHAERLPVETASCGAAWLSTVIHHIPDLDAAAREVRRVVAPGGPVLIRSAFPGRTAGISLFQYFPEAAQVVETFPSVGRVEAAFRAAGFALEKVEAVPQRTAGSLRESRARVALRADTTLRGISDEAFEEGLRRLDAAIESDDGGDVIDYLDLLVLR